VSATGAARSARTGPITCACRALVEAAHTAGRHPRYQPVVERMRARHGKKRGSKIAAIEIARQLSEATWHMLTKNQPFAPAGAPTPLAA
jgi:transposase